MQRLDKIIADRTSYSRSEIKKLIKRGEVMVDNEVCESADKRFEENADITVCGKAIGEKYIYLMMNKPDGTVCAVRDSRERTVIDILPEEYKGRGIFPVGRLDKDTTGLLILTNDGELAHRITSPKKEIKKYYIAETDKPLTEEDIAAFKEGITFRDGTKCKGADAENLKSDEKFRVGVTISEGKFHQVKKMLAVCDIKVLKLTRINIGNLYIDVKLNKGECRKLNNIEIQRIFFSNFN